MNKTEISCKLLVSLSIALSLFILNGSEGVADPRFILKPSFSLSEIYDDNIIPSTSQKEWDFYTAFEPSIEGKYFLRFTELSLSYQPSLLLFPRHFDDTRIRKILHNAKFEAKTEFSGGMILKIKDSYYSLPQRYSEASFTPSNIAQSNVVSVSSEYNMELSQTITLNVKGDFSRFDSSDSTSDGLRTGGEVSIVKNFSPQFSLGIENIINKYFYDTLTTDPFIYGLGIRPSLQLTGHIKGVFPFGYRLLRLDGIGNHHSLSYNVTVNYEDNEEKIITLFFLQEFLIDLVGNSFDRRSFGIKFEKKVLKKLSVYLGTTFSTYEDKSTVSGSTKSVLEANQGFEFELGRDFSLNVGYNGFYNKWGTGTDNLINNRAFITLKYEKGKDNRE